MGRSRLQQCALGLLAMLSAPLSLAAEERTLFQHLRLEGHRVRWMTVKDGQDAVVTYGIAHSDVASDGAVNCPRLAPLDALAATNRISPDAFRRELAAAFELWSSVARIRFVEAAPDTVPNIIVGAQAEPVGRAFAQVYFDKSAADDVKPITGALVCLNPRVPWKIGFDGNLDVYDLRYTLTHEIGHAIGLDHPEGRGQLMGYRYDERLSALNEGDIAGVTALYGVRERRGNPAEHATLAPRRATQGVTSRETAPRSPRHRPL